MSQSFFYKADKDAIGLIRIRAEIRLLFYDSIHKDKRKISDIERGDIL